MKNVIILFLAMVLVSCANPSKQGQEYGEQTLELIEIVESNPEIKSLLLASIEQAKRINPDRVTNPAQSLEEYYAFVTWAETAMPWSLLEVEYTTTLYEKIDQSLCYFFYINDQPLEELEGRGLFNNSLQYVEPYTSWLTGFTKAWGSYLDTEASWNEEYYRMALADSTFGLHRDWYEDPSNWDTFNEFFVRYLKSPDMRPIAAPDDPSVVVSPADAVPQGVWEIDANSMIVGKKGVAVKSATLYDVRKLIGEESPYADDFAGGILTHSFLDVGDYHRYHFPLGGIIREVRIIKGSDVSGGYVTWDPVNNRYKFDPSSVGWQTLETRGTVILETEAHGLVALLPIGMAPVSSVNFEEQVQVGATVSKGDMLGYFLFGGSDFIMLFQEQAQFMLDAPMEEGGNSYRHLLMGERLGYLGHHDL